MSDLNLIAIMLCAFLAVAAMVFASGQHLAARAQLRRRLPVAAGPRNAPMGAGGGRVRSAITQHFVEERFGVDTELRTRLRRDLLRAGYFTNDAINFYIFARICTVAVLPIAVFVLLRLYVPGMSSMLTTAVAGLSALIGIVGPDAYIARRQRLLAQRYREHFPDMLDLLVVCVGAGLSLEGALDRITEEIGKKDRELGKNLEMLGVETRAGRGTMDALNSLADRLALDEASSLVAMLRQSVEFGGDIGDALRIFGDEMRDKRLLRAEETANKLSVKMVLPLGMFIFPVILVIILLPIGLKLGSVLK